MKRWLLHIAFWLVYLFQNVLLIFLLNTTRLQLPFSRNLLLSTEHSLILLLPKLLFTYFILSVALKRIINGGFRERWTLYSALSLLIAVFLYRGLLVFFIDPVIYGWSGNNNPFFYALGFPVALMDIGFVSGVAITIKQIKQQLTRTKDEQLLKTEKLQTELKYLRHQTNPHFLFNTLNNIYALARKKSDNTADAVMRLSKLLRFMLYEAAKPHITIFDEIKIIEDYIDLEKIRYNERLTVSFVKNVDDEQELISPLLLLPFVENAFKHGASESRFLSYIHIELELWDGLLKFCIKNSKERSNTEDLSAKIGLSNVKRQLELLYREYDMQVMNEDSLFLISLTINLKSHAKYDLPDSRR
ncbi:MAG: sensor histidine kinase [Ginsengibacter sp.]